MDAAVTRKPVINATDQIVTPLRELIRVWPDLAKKVLDKCITNNLQTVNKSKREQQYDGVTPDSKDFEIIFDYRLLDDTLFFAMDEENAPDGQAETSNSNPDVESIARVDKSDQKSIIEDSGIEPVKGGSKNILRRQMLRRNHPLMIMVNEQKKVQSKVAQLSSY